MTRSTLPEAGTFGGRIAAAVSGLMTLAGRKVVQGIAIVAMLLAYGISSIGSYGLTAMGLTGVTALSLATTAQPAQARWRRRRRRGFYIGIPFRRRRRRRRWWR
jgi:hypothetical protein